METALRILHLEDDATDAELIHALLESAGNICQITQVQNRDDFSRALEQDNYDLILADYRLPNYDGVSALRLAQERRPDLPFIFVSGTLGEDAAIEGFSQGATDYVIKQKLSRLVPAVNRARQEVENRRERQRAEEALHESEERIRRITDNARDVIYRISIPDGRYEYINSAIIEMSGYTPDEFYANPLFIRDIIHPDWRAYLEETWRNLVLGEAPPTYEYQILHKSGEARWINQRNVLIKDRDGNPVALEGIATDNTQLKRAEQERLEHLRFFESLDKVNRAMQGTNDLDQMMRDVLDAMLTIFQGDCAWLIYPCDPESPTWQALMERTQPECPGLLPLGVERPLAPLGAEVFRILRSASGPVQFGPGSEHAVPAAISEKFGVQSSITMAIYPKVSKPWMLGLHQRSYARVWTAQEERILQEIGRRLADVLTSLLAHRDLRESEERFSKIFRFSPMSIGIIRAADERIVDVNDAFVQAFGYSREEILGQTLTGSEFFSEPAEGQAIVQLLQSQGGLNMVEFKVRKKSGEVGVALSAATSIDLAGEKHHLAMIIDITDRKQAEARILRLNRLYATLGEINQTIVQVRDQAALFRRTCEVAVNFGQFRLAWIGLIDSATQRISPTAWAGAEQGYLTDISMTSLDEALGQGPTGAAVREGRCIICQDIATDPRMAPWRERALQRGYRSAAAVPIRQKGQIVGALTVHSAEQHGLDMEDEQLLDEIGQDITYALDAFEQEAQRRRAEVELSQLNAELEQRIIERTAELARAHEQLRAILDTAGEGVVFTDRQGTIEYINPAMERLTGYSAGETLGRNPRLWKSDQTSLAVHQRMWTALLHGEIWQGELINRRKDGVLYDAALTAAPVTDLEGQVVGFVGVQHDITRQKELERLKDQFVSNVSHELRTPLTNIMLHLDLLDYGKPEKRDSYMRTLRREAQRLRKLIEDLLDLSRLDRNVTQMEPVPIDVQQLLDHLVADRSTLASERGLTLNFEPTTGLPEALADTSQLTQVVSNLMTNALSYTPAGGAVTVSTALQSYAAQNWLTITVRDTGPGIAAKDLPHLFERFYRGTAGRQASAPGTGLGLAISHEIMERLGGRITIESEPGHGAAFIIWLPIANGG